MAVETQSPLADRTNPSPHCRLRLHSSPTSSSKSPPTYALSLSSATSTHHLAATFVPFPVASDSCVPFPHDDSNDDATTCGDSPEPTTPHRQRARTTHVATPRSTRTALAPLRLPPPPSPSASSSPRAKSRSANPKTTRKRTPSDLSISISHSSFTSKTPAPTPTDLRLLALIERSISARLCELDAEMDVDGDIIMQPELDAQDALLAAHLRTTLTRHRWRGASRSPTRLQTGITIAPSPSTPSLLGVESPPAPSCPPTPAPALRFILPSPTGRTRSGSRSSTSSADKDVPPMCALVARLMIRRAERGRAARTRATDVVDDGPPRKRAKMGLSPLASDAGAGGVHPQVWSS